MYQKGLCVVILLVSLKVNVDQEIAVTEEEGCLDSFTEEIISRALPRSHFDMNKFAKPTEHDFETVCDHLLEMRNEAKSILEARGQGE